MVCRGDGKKNAEKLSGYYRQKKGAGKKIR
jgi:hypothetical protein